MMNEFERVKMMNDPRWTINTKCDIIENLMKLGEAEKNTRHAGMDVELQNETKYLRDLKNDIKKYQQTIKDANTHYKETILSGLDDRTLVERYRYIHPDGIKSRIDNTIHKVRNESNLLKTIIDKKKKMLEKIKHEYYSDQENCEKTRVNHKAKVIMSKVADMDKKISLVDFNNRKTEEMINLARQNIFKYDFLIEQLQNDAGEMATNIMKEIEIGTYFKEDTANYLQNKIDEKIAIGKRINKEIFRMDKLNSIMDSLEHNRKKLMQTKSATDEEEKFYSQLPWTTIDNDDLSFETRDISNLSISSMLPTEHIDWANKMSEFGMMYFVEEKDKIKLFENINNNANTSSVDYTFPQNPIDYITLDDTVPSKDKLAVNYVLTKTKFNNTDDFCKYIEYTKDKIVQLKKFKTLRTTLWNLLLKKSLDIQEITNNLNLMTDKEIEFSKQKEILESFIEDQNKKINDLDKTKTRYIRLLNDLYFYMNNVRSTLNKINFSDDDTKRYSTNNISSQDKTLKAPNIDITTLVEELRSMLGEIEGKIRWCNMIIPDDFNPDNLNLAHALYAFKIQTHIQEDSLMKQKKLENISRKKVYVDTPKTSNGLLLTREDVKKQAKLIIKYFNEKDLDSSKNKRKPISFRKSFI